MKRGSFSDGETSGVHIYWSSRPTVDYQNITVDCRVVIADVLYYSCWVGFLRALVQWCSGFFSFSITAYLSELTDVFIHDRYGNGTTVSSILASIRKASRRNQLRGWIRINGISRHISNIALYTNGKKIPRRDTPRPNSIDNDRIIYSSVSRQSKYAIISLSLSEKHRAR